MSSRELTRIVGFFVIGGAVAVGLHALITCGLRRTRTSEVGVLNRAVSGEVNADILITGSSRAHRDYDSGIIQKLTGRRTFNLARNGSHTDIQLAVLRCYLRHNKKPGLVIHNLDMHSFVLTPRDEIYDPAQYVPLLSESEIYEPLKKIKPDCWKWKYVPLYAYCVEDMNLTWALGLRSFCKPGHSREIDGYEPQDLNWTGAFDRFKSRHPDGVSFEVEKDGVLAVQQLIETCRSNEIKLILVYAPQYSEMLPLVKNREDIFGEFRQIAADSGVDFWDYSSSPLSQKREYFYDSQHLNRSGAERFSEELGTRLVRADSNDRASVTSTGSAKN
jgi:hypothetical protein